MILPVSPEAPDWKCTWASGQAFYFFPYVVCICHRSSESVCIWIGVVLSYIQVNEAQLEIRSVQSWFCTLPDLSEMPLNQKDSCVHWCWTMYERQCRGCWLSQRTDDHLEETYLNARTTQVIYSTVRTWMHIVYAHCESAKVESVCQRKSLFFLIHSSTLALS